MCVLTLLLACLCSCSQSQQTAGAAEVVGITLVEDTGLLEAEELPESTFAYEVMPQADNHIYQMRIEYYGGDNRDFLGQLVLEPERGGYFTREETFRRGFTVMNPEYLKNFSLAFTFVDENDVETPADNEYTVNAEYGLTYLVVIEGSAEDGYRLKER